MTRFRLLTTIVGVVAAFILALPASASPPVVGTGTGTISIRSITPILTPDGHSIEQRELEGTVLGSLEGTYVQHVRGVVHSTGLVTFQGTMTFTGTVEGCGSGTLTLGITGQGVAGVPVTEARVRAINAASNTIAAYGAGTVSQVGPNLTYEVKYQCR
jgi:hypothetical protein